MAKEAAPAQNTEAPNKKKKTLLIIIAAVLAVVLLGGGGAIYLLTTKPAAEHKADGEEIHVEDDHPPVYEKLETFTVNLSDQESYLQVDISLKVADSKVQEKIKTRMPEVRDTLLRLLSSKSVEELSMREGKENLAKDVAKEINTLIGGKKDSPGVKDVLFTAFIIQ